MGLEEQSIRKAESGIRGIRMGTKNPDNANVGYFLNKVKTTNEGMYEELVEKYKKVMNLYNQRNN